LLTTAGAAAGSKGGGGVFAGGGGGGYGGRSDGPSGTGSSYSYADGRTEDDRINADELRGQTDHDDEDKYTSTGAKVTTTKKKRPILPVGIKREDIQEGGVELTTAEDIAAGEQAAGEGDGSDEESMWVDAALENRIEPGMKKDDEVWTHVAPKPREKVMIKNERGELVEATAIDEIVDSIMMKQPSSPEQQKKPLVEKKVRKGPPKDAEDEQIAQDMERLVSLLTLGAQQQEQKPDADGNPPYNPLEGNLFLFQLPPVLPPLKITRQPRPGAQDGPVKPEPEDDVVMLDQPAASIDLTGTSETPDRGVKTEDGMMDMDGDDRPGAGKEPLYPPEGGYVGKLVVRRSGKVELDWGGQTLDMVPGIQSNFLTTAVLVEETNPGARSGESAGVAYGMGKIEGKFILAPKWGEEEEWVVDPQELEVEGVEVGPCL
jgi:DNA-directed RNA polymerase III subunit RPC4